jgi:cell division protein FtsB
MSYKKLVVRIALGLEIILFFGNYLVSNNGLHAIIALKQENEQLLQESNCIKADIQKLEEELILWHKYSFYKEDGARKQLLAREKESIYYTS